MNGGLHVGQFLSLLLSLRIGRALGTYKAGLWAAALVTGFGLVANFVLLRMERNYEYDAVMRKKYEGSTPSAGRRGSQGQDGEFVGIGDGTPTPTGHRELLDAPTSNSSRSTPVTIAGYVVQFWRGVAAAFLTVKTFTLRYWLVNTIAMSYGGSYIVFLQFARQLFEDRNLYNCSTSESSLLSAAFVALTIPFNPFIGVVANRTSQRAISCALKV